MPNYRSLIGGYYSSPSDIGKVNASIWSNNPGAINGNAKWVQEFPGFVRTSVIGGGNPIAIMETPEQGVALWYMLMVRYRALGATNLTDIVNTYGGGQDYSEYVRFVVGKTGFDSHKEITLSDDAVLLPFFKAMCHYEAGGPTPLSDAQILYGFNLARGKTSSPTPAPSPRPIPNSEHPAPRPWWRALLDALFHREKPSAPISPPPTTFAEKIVAAMRKHDCPIDEGDDVVNIVYIAGCNEDGTPNDNRINAFDDLRLVLRVGKDGPTILGAWQATIETGVIFTQNPIAEDGKGAARIAWGHQTAWQVGLHRGAYEALVQTGGPVRVYRDNNKDYKREGDPIDTGYFGINQHHAYSAPRDDIGRNSAGCLVGRMIKSHQEFMDIVKSDSRYRAKRAFVFGTTVMPYEWLTGA